MYKSVIIFCFIFSSGLFSAQEGLSKTELLRLLTKNPHDTVRVDILNELCWPVYSYDVPDSSIYFGQKAIAEASAIKDFKRLSIAHRRIGITYSNTGDLKKSIYHQEESYRISEQIHFERGMYLALNNLGVAYLNSELLNKALSYFLRSLKYIEGTTDYNSIAMVYTNCGMIYRRSGDTKKSKEFFHRARHFAQISSNNDLVITNYCNLSSTNRIMGMNDSSSYYLTRAKALLNEKTYSQTLYNYYLSEGLLFHVRGEHKKALSSFLATKPYVTGLSDEITLLINIAEQYTYLKDQRQALGIYEQAYQLSLQNGMYDNLEFISFAMADMYEKSGNTPQYLKMIKLYIAHKDSNARMNKIQELKVQQLEFDYERKQVADSIKFEEREMLKNMELEVAESKLTRERTVSVLLICIMAIILLFGAFIFNRLQVSKKQNKIIERQKQIVELKNREILDSINYAKRLQAAILPQLEDIKKDLNADLLYLPKDIIGGDFYFFEKFRGHFFVAVCDCTGHGIPGAIMSVVCHQALSKSIKEFELSDPGLILDKTRQIIVESLNAAHQNIKDGMDCSLLVISASDRSVQWAGANNSLWVITDHKLREVMADKQQVAFYENATGYSSHKLNLEPGSSLYLYTDGYYDQFGGNKGKKYKTRSLKDFLATISHATVHEQIKLLEQNFKTWKGSLDQVDDVAIMVIKT